MSILTRAPVLCTRCQAFGLLQQGGVCAVCGGAGDLTRLILPLKIIGAADLDPLPDIWFQRMAVTLSQHTDDGRVVVRGVTDQGFNLAASLPAARFAALGLSDFVEADARWPR
jgi:hypothetical protein